MRVPAPDPRSDEKLAHALGAIADLNDAMGQLTRMIATRDAARRLGPDVRQVIPGSPGLLSASPGRVAGINLRETAGTDTVVELLDGTDDNAPVILTIAVPKNTSTVQWLLPGGISFTHGLYVTVDGGTITGNIYTATTPGAAL